MQTEATQREHYNRIGADYEAQYGDPDGLVYRERFLYGPLLAGLELEGRPVLEALSGSGHATEYLLKHKHALVTGLDISDEAIASFKERWPDSEAICASITVCTVRPASPAIMTGGFFAHSAAVRIASSSTGRYSPASRIANCVVCTPTARPPAPASK